MTDIIEKLGIKPIESFTTHSFMGDDLEVCESEYVRELEAQRNEMLKALIDIINVNSDEAFLEAVKKCHTAIQKADPKHREFSEITELLNER